MRKRTRASCCRLYRLQKKQLGRVCIVFLLAVLTVSLTGAWLPAQADTPAGHETISGAPTPGVTSPAAAEDTSGAPNTSVAGDTYAAPTPRVQTVNGQSLTMNVGSITDGWQDVDNIGNAVNWSLTVPTKQIEVIANFPTGTAQTRQVDIDIPAGYKILEMTGKSSWTPPAGVRKLDLSNEDDSKVNTVSLTAWDGGDWSTQTIAMGAAPDYYSAVYGAQRLYHGKISYTFNNNCDYIALTVTLGLDASIMSHAYTSTTLQPITVTLTGTATLTTSLTTTVQDIRVPTISATSYPTNLYGGSRSVAGIEDSADPTKGTVPQFITGYSYSCYNPVTLLDNHWVESATLTVAYPAGVTFAGFAEARILGNNITTAQANKKMVATDFTGNVYQTTTGAQNGHLTVTDDQAARTVTFQYTNTNAYHDNYAGQFWLYWTADINQNNSPIQWNDILPFQATYTGTSGALAGNEELLPLTRATVNITVKKGEAFNVQATGVALTQQDWNSYADGAYPYDQLLGQFDIYNAAPNDLTTPLRYDFTFADSLHVRGLNLPGLTGNNFSNVVVTTNLRTITLPGPFNVTNTSIFTAGYTFDAARLGLADEEYITDFQVQQAGLAAANMAQMYLNSATGYFGRWQNGVTGSATVAIYDLSDPGISDLTPKATATSNTNIGWINAGAGTAALVMANQDGTPNTTGSFYPTEQINFTATYTAASGVAGANSNDVCDPTIYISLPAGINLDLSSVQGLSVSGNHGANNWFPLQLVSTNTKVINGVTWSVYGFTSAQKLDMVALANKGFSAVLQPSGFNSLQVRFTANVSSASPDYSGLESEKIVAWDLGRNAVSVTTNTNYTTPDTQNIAGNGAGYNVVGGTQSLPLNIVPKTEFNVSLGIRIYGDTIPFYTYDGTAATVAPVSVSTDAELWLKYANLNNTAYDIGSEIYLPIPKQGLGYDHYFNNREIIDPVTNPEQNTVPQWSAYLEGPVNLPGFDTYYLLDQVYTTTPIPAGGVDGNWTPITPVTGWKTESEMSPGDWANVTMLKFVANTQILSGDSGETTFRISVDPDAHLGQDNYWRSYAKGWLLGKDGAGTWEYGSVVAGEPAAAGIMGMVFLDADNNGIKGANGNFDNSAPATSGVTALLTGGNISPINLTMQPDGSFSSLNNDSTQYFLKSGVYTVTFSNNTQGEYLFTANTPAARSDGKIWRMDVQQSDIAANQQTSTYTFAVDNNSNSTEYIGVGLSKPSSTTSAYKVEHYTVEADGSTINLFSTDTLSGVNNATVTAEPGNNPTGYTYAPDFPGTVASGTVTEDGSLVLKLYYLINKHNITYSYTGVVPAGAPAAPDPQLNVPYNTNKTLAVVPSLAGYTFSGWSTADNLPSGLNAGGNFMMPDNDLLFTGQWASSGAGGGGGGSSSSSGGDKNNQVIYHANNGLNEPDIVDSQPPGAKITIKSGDIFTAPANKVFAGWSETINGAVVYKAGDTFTIAAKDIDLYAVWVEQKLNTDDHFDYILGYPDGMVHPAADITRAEVADIFFRLLTSDSRKHLWQTTNSYRDVAPNMWFDNAISTLSNGGILNGYPDGTFRPGKPITRAEFAAIAARFATGAATTSVTFSDLNGHWAAREIYRAAGLGWVTGYPDGTFRPNQNITRAEVMALVNRVLIRRVTTEQDLLSDMHKWPDNSNVNGWYYFDVQEATNSHYYERKSDGIAEKWTALRPDPDWKAMEQPGYQP